MYLPSEILTVLDVMYRELDSQWVESQRLGAPDNGILGARVAIGDLSRAIGWAPPKSVILVAR